MEITCNIVEVKEDCIRVSTVKKKQEIDIFFPESKREAVKARYQPHMVTEIEVELQAYENGGYMFAKLWLLYVIFPTLGEIIVGTSSNPAYMAQRKMMILYRKNGD